MTSGRRRRLPTMTGWPFSDEGTAGDPMRFTTAANLANYMQVEVELSANRVTSDTFNTARIPDLTLVKNI